MVPVDIRAAYQICGEIGMRNIARSPSHSIRWGFFSSSNLGERLTSRTNSAIDF